MSLKRTYTQDVNLQAQSVSPSPLIPLSFHEGMVGGRVVVTTATAGLQKPVKHFNALLKNLLHLTARANPKSQARPASWPPSLP